MLDQGTSINDLMPAMPTEPNSNLKATGDFDKALGARVKFMRKIRGISQEKLAGQLGLTFQQVQKYETGANRFPIARLVRIASILGTSAAFLIGETGQDSTDSILAQSVGDRSDILKLLLALTQANPATVKAIQGLLDAGVQHH